MCYNVRVRVSLIFTVKNEAKALPRLIESIAAQTRPPDEILVADGGSTDSTLDLLRHYAARLPLKILSVPGANISQGRNAAIRAASGDLICSTDAGVRLDPNWVIELVRPFEDQSDADARGKTQIEFSDPHKSASIRVPSNSPDVVSGFFIADAHTVFEAALAATTLPVLADIRPEKFLPSSRSVAFHKSVWERVNGYPEWLDFCEDLIFDFALRAQNFRFVFAPSARVYFRPRPNLRAFFKQYYQYARGDGKANLWFHRHLIRYITYWVVLPLLIVLFFLGFQGLGLGILVVGFSAMLLTPYKCLLPMIRDFVFADKIRAIAWVPIIRITGDIAKMSGYPVGVVWRWNHRSTH